MEELQSRSKIESKVNAKAVAGKKDDNREVGELLMQEWDKTAKFAQELINHKFTKF